MIITQVHEITGYDIGAYAAHRLQLYKNPDYTTEHLIQLHRIPKSHHKNAQRQATEIRYCLTQADEYFQSARNATLATRPVLLYYGLMSLALAEVLVKKTAASRLEQLRQMHAAHGLVLQVAGAIDAKENLLDVCRRLAARVQLRAPGQPYGTFEVWRSETREAPLPASVTTHHPGGAFSSGILARFAGSDAPPPIPPSRTYPLLDAVESIPQLRSLLRHIGIQPKTVRAVIKEERQDGGHGSFTPTPRIFSRRSTKR